MQEDKKEHVTLTQAAEMLGIERPRVYKLVRQRALNATWIARPPETPVGPTRVLGISVQSIEKRLRELRLLAQADRDGEVKNGAETLVTAKRASEVLGVTYVRVQQMRGLGMLKARKFGRRVLICKDSLEELAAERAA